MVAKKIEITGIVQGVGFRPFIYKLAHEYKLLGNVANTSNGVMIHVQGPLQDIDSFCGDIVQKAPPLSHITSLTVLDDALTPLTGFSIEKSVDQHLSATLISPDIATCEDCLDELHNPGDRRFRYPFTNCTNCGPRYTIIDNIPYDRPYTSMKHFNMCRQCQSEYDDPADRRFHAQPNACPKCGPQLSLYRSSGQIELCNDPISKVIELLQKGNILAIKGLGGFHLAVDATNDAAVKQLRRKKAREEKPFALMVADVDHAEQIATVSSAEKNLLNSVQRPIVLLAQKNPTPIAPSVSPGNRYFGIMLPYTPLHHLLFCDHAFAALVMTSGNISDEPIVIDNQEAFTRLGDIADYILVHNRDIHLRSDDSIMRFFNSESDSARPGFIRRSRGYVPRPVFLDREVPPILACGAHLKNTICLTRGNQAFVSQHIGDLDNLETLDFFKLTIRHLKQILSITPEKITCDLHPDYLSTQYARQIQVSDAHGDGALIQVQHHHAHIASCMAENHVSGPVIGLALDGTGFGTDGHIWGGEILLADFKAFDRLAQIEYIPMPGSAAAIKEPWRMAVSYLYKTYGMSFTDLDLELLRSVPKANIQMMIKMIDTNLNAPMTSSLGRLFDGIAALIGIRHKVSFEGQAAMELEMAATPGISDRYEYAWNSTDMDRIEVAPIVTGVVEDLGQKFDKGVISAKFHNTLIELFGDMVASISARTKIKQVALSGGVFQNALLSTGLAQTLVSKGFSVFTHHQVPTNDGGISLGQAMIAASFDTVS